VAVTITSGEGSSYTFGGATWDWNDVRGAKTWATAYATSYACTEADAAPAFVEARRVNIAATDPEVFAVGELRRSTITDSQSEAFATAEARSDVWTAARTFAETLATVERRFADVGAFEPEVFSFVSARTDVWNAISKAFSTFSTAETYVDFCVWIQANLESFQTQTLPSRVFQKRALAEVFATSEARRSSLETTVQRALGIASANRKAVFAVESEAFSNVSAQSEVWSVVRTLAEAFATAERQAASVSAIDAESFAVAENRTDVVAFARSFSSACAFAENRTDVWQVVRSQPETFATAEKRVASTTKVPRETLQTNESRSDVWTVTRNLAEPLGVTSAAPTNIFRSSASAFSIVDARADVVQFVRNFSSAISWTEIYFDNISWINAIDETCSFSAVYRKGMGVFESEVFTATDRLAKSITAPKTRALSIGESYTDLIAWIQANSESVAFAEQTPTAIAKQIVRTLAVRDMLLRNASGVFADLSVRSSSMTAAQFADLFSTRHPEGYEDFKQYLPGDYKFQKALINIALIPTDGASQTLSLQSARTTVDVPDVTDRGSQTLTTAGATISYARTFYIPPEIRIQQTSGAGPAIAMVSNVTTTSFFVRLFDAASPSTPVSGSISWSAFAY
jgi:hypothetical protein